MTYSSVVKNHFVNPRNVGELENPDGVGIAKNQMDGDQIQLHIKVKEGRIIDIRMKVMGCVAAIAATSLFTEWAKGKSIQQATQISKEELVEQLGGLPEQKIRCSLTCIDAMKEAVKNLK